MDVSSVPLSMREREQWVGWRYETREGKRTKVPIDVHTGRLAATDNPKTWASFEEVMTRLQRRGADLAGAGYVFSGDDSFTGIDLDNCLSGGAIKPWAVPFVSLLDSYTEITPSGNGLHIILCGQMEGGRHKVAWEDGAIEVYDRLRYFTMTGRRWNGCAAEPLHRQESLSKFCAQVLPPKEAPTNGARTPAPVSLDDRELIEMMFASKTGARIQSLWRGDTSDYAGDDSAADLALLDRLAFWTGRDAPRMDALFRQSALYREKWERQDYRDRTIEKAISGCMEVYTPPVRREHPKYVQENHNDEGGGGLIPLPRLYTAAELRSKVLAEPVWAVEQFIPAGCTILVAHSKIGKTFLAEDAAVAVALGGMAWGKVPVRQGPVIYLDTEGNERRVQRRLGDLLGEEPWPEHLYLTHEAITLDPNGLLVVKLLIQKYKARMCVLDTFNAMRPGRKAIGDLVKEDYDMIRSLRLLGEENDCANLLLHHCSLTKKDDSVNAGAGTHGLAAAASAVLSFGRARGEHDAMMDVTGNDITEEKKHHFTRDTRTGFWTLQGPGEGLMSTAKKQKVHDVVAALGKTTPAAVAAALGEKYDAVQKAMKRMTDEGELIRDGGEYSIPIWIPR